MHYAKNYSSVITAALYYCITYVSKNELMAKLFKVEKLDTRPLFVNLIAIINVLGDTLTVFTHLGKDKSQVGIHHDWLESDEVIHIMYVGLKRISNIQRVFEYSDI